MNTEENHCYKVLNDSTVFFSSSSCWLSVVCGYCLHYSCPPQTVIEMEPPCIIQKKKWEVLYSFGGGIAYIYSLAAAAGISVSVTANGADRIDRFWQMDISRRHSSSLRCCVAHSANVRIVHKNLVCVSVWRMKKRNHRLSNAFYNTTSADRRPSCQIVPPLVYTHWRWKEREREPFIINMEAGE